MRIKYRGGRSHYEISLNRKPYYFTPENNRTCDIQDRAVVNYIFSLPNNAEFEVVMEEVKPDTFTSLNKTDDIVDLKPKIIKKAGRPKKGGR